MSQSTTRLLIIILGLFTAIVHLILLNIGPYGVQYLFVLNGLGYLGLLGALVFRIPKGKERLVHYAFMAYTLVTILAWVAIGTRSTLGYSTKLVEVLLIILLWLDLKRLPAAKQS